LRDGPKKLAARNWNGWAEAGQSTAGSSLAEADQSRAGWERAALHKGEARSNGWRLDGCNWSEAH
jgi:hypothetical protein